jgi:hypothetical protein
MDELAAHVLILRDSYQYDLAEAVQVALAIGAGNMCSSTAAKANELGLV